MPRSSIASGEFVILHRLAEYTVPALIVATLVAAAVYGLSPREVKEAERYRVEKVDRGNLSQVIHANGTLNPVSLIRVGTQISGTIQSVHVDFNSRVRAGQILARLDPILLEASVAQSEANLAQADVAIDLRRAQLKRSQQLVEQRFLSPAKLEEDERAVMAAAAAVKLAQAQLRRDRANLNYSIIRSPVDGVVVARSIDVGQTVAAAFQTPTLFQIAQDLRAMQIDTAIAEADVGTIKIDMPIMFSVDAYPKREFLGTVKQLRLNPSTQQNVVTYNAVIRVDNLDAVLLPGMTAHVSFTIGTRQDVLRIPNAALRFQPTDEQLRKQPTGGSARVFRLRADGVAAVRVETGVSDGLWTELVQGELAVGDDLVVREITPVSSVSRPRLGMRLF
jgi:HlyD family secretion protein